MGEAAEVRHGSVIRAAERLGAVVPPGRPRVVAHFAVATSGRIRPAQRATIRLEGFPWTQYGTLAAVVADVGTEPIEGLIRVELTLVPGQESPIPLGHGLPGSAEIEVEQISPAVLVLRAAGQFLAIRPASMPKLAPGDRGRP